MMLALGWIFPSIGVMYVMLFFAIAGTLADIYVSYRAEAGFLFIVIAIYHTAKVVGYYKEKSND